MMKVVYKKLEELIRAHLMRKGTVLLLSIAVVGCSSARYAVIDGSRIAKSDGHAHAVFTSNVDDRMYLKKEYSKTIEPGKRIIKLTTTKSIVHSLARKIQER